jgi:hypothetical protein
MLAGVSIDYYTQLERGNTRGVSDEVLDAVAGALGLDEAERAHLFDLARAARRARPRAAPPRATPHRDLIATSRYTPASCPPATINDLEKAVRPLLAAGLD